MQDALVTPFSTTGVDEDLVEAIRRVIKAGEPVSASEFDAFVTALDGQEAVPEVAFKLMTVARFPPSEAQAVFWTSGTTSGTPGRHVIRDLELYRLSAVQGFSRFVGYAPLPRRFLSLIPSPTDRPHSSLSAMVSFVCEAFAVEPPVFCREGDAIVLPRVDAFLARAVAEGTPVCLLGTTLDFLTLFDAFRERGSPQLRLPPGSRAMHTGGAKASGREVRIVELRERFAKAIGIDPLDVVEEYGMTELLSQAYDSPRVTPGPRRFVPVPWMRSRVVEPLGLSPVPVGGRGILLHQDLANCHSAVSVLTSDLATAAPDGFSDISRAPGASPRGCSSDAGVRTA